MFIKTINRITLKLEPETAGGCLADVISHLSALRDYYPEFDSWFDNKVLPDIYAGDRSILVEYRRSQLAGFAIVKDDGYEKKLCCLRVLEDFQNSHGLGIRLFERAFEELETDKPLLSVAEERLSVFSRIFQYFRFESYKEYIGRYRAGRVEYAFNGLLDVPVNSSRVSLVETTHQ